MTFNNLVERCALRNEQCLGTLIDIFTMNHRALGDLVFMTFASIESIEPEAFWISLPELLEALKSFKPSEATFADELRNLVMKMDNSIQLERRT